VAGRESRAEQQMELVAAALRRTGRENATTGQAPQAHTLDQGTIKAVYNHLGKEHF